MPNNWKKYLINDIANAIAMGPFGSNIKRENFISEGVPVIRGGNLNDFRYVSGDFVFLTESKAESLKNSIAYPDELVFTHRGTIGQVGLIPKEKYPKYVVSQSQLRLSLIKEIADPQFIFYWFKSDFGQQEWLKNSSQVGVPAIASPTKSLKDIEINLPSLPEQQAIAEILSSLDDKIELNLQINKTLEEMANALYKHWFVDFGPFKDGKFIESELGMIPEGWEVDKLKSLILDFNNKRGPISSMEREKIKGKYPYYGATGILDYVDKFGFDGRYILVAEDGTVKNKTNNPYLQFIEGQFWVSNHAHIIRGNEKFPDSFVYYTLNNAIVLPYITGAVQPKLSKGSLESMVILKPTSDIAIKYSKIADEIVNLIFQNDYETDELKQTRDYLLPKLISGEIRVKEAIKKVKEVL